MSSNARTYILNRIKVALDAKEEARADVCASEWHEIPRYYRRIGTLNREDRIALFDQRIRHYNGNPFYSSGDVRADIGNILSQRGKRILIVPPAFPTEWRPSGL